MEQALKQGVNYQITKHIGKISENRTNWKELNLISYNGFPAKYDLRKWTKDEDGNPRMGRGITLNTEETVILRDLLNKIDLD